MVHRSAVVQVSASTLTEAIDLARARFDEVWDCTPDTRPFDLRQAHAEPAEPGRWTVTVDAEDA
jgi:hypothetical protein